MDEYVEPAPAEAEPHLRQIRAILKGVAEYRTGKDSIHFRYDQPLPEALIRKMAAHRVADVHDNDARWMY